MSFSNENVDGKWHLTFSLVLLFILFWWLCFITLCFWDRVSLLCRLFLFLPVLELLVDQAVLDLTEICLPLSLKCWDKGVCHYTWLSIINTWWVLTFGNILLIGEKIYHKFTIYFSCETWLRNNKHFQYHPQWHTSYILLGASQASVLYKYF